MQYDDIHVGQRLRIATKRRPEVGVVHAKERAMIAGKEREIIYMDTIGGRRLCAPSVLEEVTPGEAS